MIVGYARVSTKDQNLDRQIDMLVDYGVDIRNIYKEKMTGTNIERHDPDLISIVEELGTEKASGKCARLKVEDIGEEHYHINDYDGYESVITSLGDDYWK